MEIKFPIGFEKKFEEILEDEFPKLEACLHILPKKCIRVNTLKISKEKLKQKLEKNGWKLEEVSWYENAFFVETEENLAKTKEFFLGYYYIQDAASLVPVLVLDPKPNETILDACAAPGSKTTFIVELMKNEGFLIACDVEPKRIKALSFNLQKIGATNAVVIMMDVRKISNLGISFDKILVDAPCSGSGTFISSYRVLNFWSNHVVEKLSRLQKELLKACSKVLKPNGILVYSTCSLDPEENEMNLEYAVKKLGFIPEYFEVKGLKYRIGLESYGKINFEYSKYSIRFYPFENQTEGFFVCKLRKQG